MTKTTLSRRTMFGAAAALAAAPVAAGQALASGTTTIGRLWSQAESLNDQLAAHRAAITEAAANGGISGWMRLGGQANVLGQRRYDALVAILKTKPESTQDLAILGKVVLDGDIQNGARNWAGEQLANATVAFHGTRAA
ncbi:MAG: hypothetical protein ACRC56_09850 [Bosea sp. (in: a-proteobacteria)]